MHTRLPAAEAAARNARNSAHPRAADPIHEDPHDAARPQGVSRRDAMAPCHPCPRIPPKRELATGSGSALFYAELETGHQCRTPGQLHANRNDNAGNIWPRRA